MSIIDFLEKRNDENIYDYIKRITFGKRDSIYDIDYTEWSKLVLGKEYASDESRKRFYGACTVIEILDEHLYSMLPKTQLTKAKQLIGEQLIIKKQIQADKSEINRLSKNFIKSLSIVEELCEILKENNFTVIVPEYCHEELDVDSEYDMLLHISDWHIGYVIDNCKGNYYNFEIANQRVEKLISQCKRYCELYNVKKIYVVNTGDNIEGIAMRKNQSQFCEFNQSMQINKAIEIIYKLLVALCGFSNVEYDSIYGNHDRINGDASANLDGDNADTVISEQIANYQTLSNNVRLSVIKRKHTDKEIIKNINDIKFKFVHGDHSKKDDRTQIRDEISMDNEFYDVLVKGHYHNFSCLSENNGRYIVTTGCLSGFNDYSVNFGCTSIASQSIFIVGNKNIELIKDVQLC